jgi:hypothetical protein
MRHETHPATQHTDVPALYEIHVAGRIGPLVRAALSELTASVAPTFTVLTGSVHRLDDLQRLLDSLAEHGTPVADLRITTHRAPPEG